MIKNFSRIMVIFLMLFVAGMTVCAAEADDIKKNRVFQVSSDVELHGEPDTASAVTAVLPGGTPVIVKEDAQDGWCRVGYREQTGYVQVSFLSVIGSPVIPAAANDQAVPESAAALGSGEQEDDKTAQNSGVQSEDKPAQDSAEPSEDRPAQDGIALTDDRDAQNSRGLSEDKTVQRSEAQADSKAAQGGAGQPDDSTGASARADTLDDEFRMIQEQNLLAYQEAEAAKEQAKSDRIWGIVIAVLVAAIFVVGIFTTLAGNKGKKRRQ